MFSNALHPLRVDSQAYKVEFENSRVRVLRVRIAPRRSAPMHEYVLNHVVVCLSDQSVREIPPAGKAAVAQRQAGDFAWRWHSKQKLKNRSDKPLEEIVAKLKN